MATINLSQSDKSGSGFGYRELPFLLPYIVFVLHTL
jgi:hypothetical protein